ncbi:protease modulator HflC [Chrysiogenes arsenatis]|uniref:protease modulator HflC n=1 Tax=Chrysiogenes arsenatis TaxID=309797 RepID=UPI0003FFDFE3|nr:protease modulator HflC [Chrysiogenes arsenatis]
MKIAKFAFPLVAVLIAVASFSMFIVDFTQHAIITQLGKPVRAINDPGLYFRLPFVQDVQYFEKRLLLFDGSPTEMITRDKKNIVVDSYVVWRIADPLRFLTSVQNEAGGNRRIGDVMYGEARREIGSFDLIQVINHNRLEIMNNIAKGAAEKVADLGIQIIDMRIKRADLPTENERAIYDRMRSEREKMATLYRSEGEEEAQKIRAETDREKEIMLAEAYGNEQRIRGEGDALAAKIYADGLSRAPEFYRFMRELDLYKSSIHENSTIILDNNSVFYKRLMEKK